ncbi:hypothetical protein BCR44DRAFT_1495170 [Catenaria anguillulae PL171]|uniref:EH domain-containing protein n=1 Tax=Catenaria anguillulae PL171 TaxID=765915 RepID=A0A1Y2I4H3_9FUNG|nr:hypothetical protein BCR44DRAFT_1495170 [Catenaria anguillulae PL171]
MSTQSVRDRIALFNASSSSSSSASGSREDLTPTAHAGDGVGVIRSSVANGPREQQDDSFDANPNPWAAVASPPIPPATGGMVTSSGLAGLGTANGTADSTLGSSTRQGPPPRPARRTPTTAAPPAATITSSQVTLGSGPTGWVAFGLPSSETAVAASNPIVPARPPIAAFASFNHGTSIPQSNHHNHSLADSTSSSIGICPPPGARPLVPIPTTTAAAAPSPVSALNHPLASAASTSNTPPPLPPRVGPSASTSTSSTFSATSDTYANSAATSRSVSPVSLASNGGAGTPRPAATAAPTTNQLAGLVKNMAISTSQASLSGRSSPTNAAKLSGFSSNTTADSIFPTIPPQTRSRYLSLFRTLTAASNPINSGASSPVDASVTAPAQAIVSVWRRSRLPLATLADVWDAVVAEPRAIELNGMQFCSGMWIIDQVLGGKSVEQFVTL